MEDKEEDKAKKFRSPQFPFIALDKAVARAREFEGEYHQHAARMGGAVKTWKYAEKSSGGIQTVAALAAFGLMEDEGALDSRRVKLTPLAMTILKDTRTGAAAAALKTAALKPKVLADLWEAWGVSRPPDHECVSTLHLDKKFSEDAATRLLGIYDATIRFAGLADGDKTEHNPEEREDSDKGGAEDKKPLAPVVRQPAPPGKVPLMENERVVFAHELRPNQSFRIVVSGEVDKAMVDALKAFADFQMKLVAPQNATPATPEKSDAASAT